MRRLLLLTLVFYATGGHAQTVYKCAAKGTPTSFQSQPCPAGSRTVKTVAAIPEPYRTPAYQPRPTQQVQNDVVVHNNVQTTSDRAQRSANCQSEKNNREATLQRVGLKRTYNLLQKLDAAVNNACKDT